MQYNPLEISKISFALVSLVLTMIFVPSLSATTNDSIPPIITSPATDLQVSCNTAVEDSLQNWFDRYAGLTATDESNDITLSTTITASEALDRLDLNTNISCGNTGSVAVGFYALDSCMNSTDTLTAQFTVIDITGPTFTTLPADLTVICNAARSDSLNAWLRDFGGAQVVDDCDLITSIDSFLYDEGSGPQRGSFDDDLVITPDRCDYQIIVSFIAIDECGNRSQASATFSLIDTVAPIFEQGLPDTVRVNCDNIPSARSVNVTDNCLGTIAPVITDVTTQDPNESTCEHFNYRVERTYTATDLCGNSSRIDQVIFVTDTLEPRFIAPPDTTISNSLTADPEITGFPIDIIDNCSSEVIIDYTDNRTINDCSINIDRRWNIRDICGSSLVLSQNITILDSIPPVVVTEPIDIILSCTNGIDIGSGFEEWVASRGSAIVRDELGEISQSFAAVPGSYDIDNPNTWPGENPDNFNAPSCPSEVIGLTQFEIVDFVFVDNCGNALALQGTFGLSDDVNPQILTAINDTQLFVVNTDDCTTPFTISPFIASDNCLDDNPNTFRTGNLPITAASTDVPVEPVILRFGPFESSLADNNIPVDLSIRLLNVDANNPTEYFDIVAESGNIIGRTNNTVAQCGDGTTMISIPRQEVIQGLTNDQFFEITLSPNIVEGVPTLSINTVCSNSAASGVLNIGAIASFDITYSLQVDDQQAQVITDATFINLSAGVHRLKYLATDCAGNQDSIIQNVTVTDTSGIESIACPQDIVTSATTGQCNANVELIFGSSTNACQQDLMVDSITITGPNQQSIQSPTEGMILTLDVGRHDIIYHYNTGASCQQEVTIRDQEFPQIICNSDIPFIIHPSGVAPTTLDTSAIFSALSDNCGIGVIDIETPTFGCSDIGTSISITVRVSDLSGNTTVCNSNLRITSFNLEPSAEAILCIGDTIRLFANAPKDIGEEEFIYNWTGPDGFTSNDENPVVANSTLAAAGRYTLDLLGANGCSVSGNVDVIIQDFTAPAISTAQNSYCDGDSVLLETTEFNSAVIYSWYEGVFPNGQLIASSESPSARILPDLGAHEYYLLIESNACDVTFEPSNPVMVDIVSVPELSVVQQDISICHGETLTLAGITDDDDLSFSWTGPADFVSDSLTPMPIEGVAEENEGDYIFKGNRGFCADSIVLSVSVRDSLTTPIISGSNQYCNEASGELLIANYMIDTSTMFEWYLNDEFFTATDSTILPLPIIDSTTTGTWTVRVNNGQCISDESISFDISIIDDLNINIDRNSPVCENDSIRFSIPAISGASYNWSGPGGFSSTEQNPSAPPIGGIYSVSIDTESGCNTIASTSVSVDPIPQILTLFADTEDCTDGTNQTLLFSSVFPDDNVNYNWSGPNEFSSTEARPRLINYTSEDNGVYRLILTRGACISDIDSIVINVEDIPAAPVLRDSISACSGDTISININSNDTLIQAYQWTTPIGVVTTPNSFLTLPDIAAENAGQYFVSAISGSCESPTSDTIEINVFESPDAPELSANTPICAGEEIVLSTERQNNATYEWIGPDGFSSDDISITLDSDQANNLAQYGLRVVLNGCPSSFTFAQDVMVEAKPNAPVVTTMDQSVCAENDINIELCIDRSSIVADGSINWINTTNDVQLGTTNDTCLTLNTVTALLPGVNNIVAEIMTDGCPSDLSNPVLIELFGVPDVTARAGDDLIVCEANDILISAVEPLRGVGSWSSDDPDITFSEVNNHNTRVFGLRRGANRLTWSLSNGNCIDFSTDETIITFEEDVIAQDDEENVGFNSSGQLNVLDNDEFLPTDYNITLIQEPTVGTLTIDNDILEITYTPEAQFIGNTSFQYEICSNSCIDNCDIATVSVKVGDDNDCIAPTIITPNNDGINDEFFIPCLDSGNFVDNELIVYNEWGDEVYYAQPYDNSWGGTYNGELLPSGTYFFVFKASDTQEPTKGFLIIQR